MVEVRGSKTTRKGCKTSYAMQRDAAKPVPPTVTSSPFSFLQGNDSPGSVWHKRWLRTHLWMPLNLVRTFGNTAVLKAPAPLLVGKFYRRQEEKHAVLSKILQGKLLSETELGKNDCNKPSFIFTLGWGRGSLLSPAEELQPTWSVYATAYGKDR